MKFFRRQKWEREMTDELRFHIDAYVDDLIRGGVDRSEAERRARVEFGGVEGVKEECRQATGFRWLDELKGDLRYAFRTLGQHPGFTAIAVLSLALGIGANTAVFSMVDAVMLRLLPVRDPANLVFVENAGSKGGNGGPPYPCFELLRDGTHHMEGMAAFSATGMVLVIDGQRELVRGQYVSGNYYDLIGVKAVIGRTLTAADDRMVGTGGIDGPVGVISYGYWQSRFSGSPAVLGRVIHEGNRAVTIVGVIPPNFSSLETGRPIDVSFPMMLSDPAVLRDRGSWWLDVVGRLKNGSTPEEARAELNGIFKAFMSGATTSSEITRELFDHIELSPAGKGMNRLRKQFFTPLLALMTIVALVLLIACANVANLMLARATARRKEFAVRLALGASRARLMRQALTEAMLLVTMGTLLALVVAQWSASALSGFLAGGKNPITLDIALNARVLLFAVAVAILTGLLFGIAPALRSARVDPGAGLQAASRSATSSRHNLRLGRWLVITQVALSTILLAGAGLFVRSLWNLKTLDPGFRKDGVLTMEVAPRKELNGQPRWMELQADILERLKGVEGVRDVSLASMTPMSGRDRGVLVSIPGFAHRSEHDRAIHLTTVTPGFFATFGAPVQLGRSFSDADTANSTKVAILNETAARFYFEGRNPLGQKLGLTKAIDPYEIVGVVRDMRQNSLRREVPRMVYLPVTQAIDRVGRLAVSIRSDRDLRRLVGIARGAVRAVDPDLLITNVTTVEEQVDESLLQERLVSSLASVFGALALVLACIGLYGILSYAVARRTSEIGIRMALGAGRAAVTCSVLREAVVLVVIGIALGAPAVYGCAKLLKSFLYQVDAADPIILTGAILLLLCVAVLSATIPARRASRVDPMVALRCE